MKNNIIIAGVPRAGKSMMAHLLSRKYGYKHVSMDAIVAGFERVFPELGIAWFPSKATDIPPLDVLRNVSGKIALFIAAMLDSGEYDEFAPGMVVDVYQLFPGDCIKHLKDKNCEIVYLLTSDVTPEERLSILKTYDEEKDYTFGAPDDELYEGCIQMVEQSQYIKSQCIEHNISYYETAKDRIDVFRQIIESFSAHPII